MRTYCIHTDSDKYYYLSERGGLLCITQANRYWEKGASAFSSAWTVSGFREVLPFCNLGRMLSAEQLLKETNGEWRGATFKNGRGRFVLVDVDHGTRRAWSDRINTIWEVKQ